MFTLNDKLIVFKIENSYSKEFNYPLRLLNSNLNSYKLKRILQQNISFNEINLNPLDYYLLAIYIFKNYKYLKDLIFQLTINYNRNIILDNVNNAELGFLDLALHLGIIINYNKEENTVSIQFPNHNKHKIFLMGGWFEYYVYCKLLNKYYQNKNVSLLLTPEIIDKNDKKYETDLLLLKNKSIYIIECKCIDSNNIASMIQKGKNQLKERLLILNSNKTRNKKINVYPRLIIYNKNLQKIENINNI